MKSETKILADSYCPHQPTPKNNVVTSSYPTHGEERLHDFHSALCYFNFKRLVPGYAHEWWLNDINTEYDMRIKEGDFLEAERKLVQSAAQQAPEDADAFLNWFENLREHGPGQNDPLFPWLSVKASLTEMCWFLQQEAAGEAGFDDLVAMTQVRLPARAKLEMARNYWDEMGRGNEEGMHGRMLTAVVTTLNLKPRIGNTVWQALALANLMVGLAANRRYAYQAIGALGAIEMTAPGRVAQINAGLKRLGAPVNARRYFQLHS
ncbi:MAG TPA: iron-containing redox enzyme family protein, partial [Gammaproteobacteria bacterium]